MADGGGTCEPDAMAAGSPRVHDILRVLAEEDDAERLEAVGHLLRKLKENQNPSGEEVSGDLLYTVKRLVKGLSSRRKWVRVGFPVALCQVLRSFPEVKVDLILNLVEENLNYKAISNKYERKHVDVGRALAFQSIVQSGRLFAKGKHIKSVVNQMSSMQTKRSYLQYVCTIGISQIISKIDTAKFNRKVWPLIEADLKRGWNNCTPDRLQLLLVSKQHHPETLTRDFLKSHWESHKIIKKKTYDNVFQVLMKCTVDYPFEHSVNNEIIRDVVSSGCNLTEFWMAVGVKLLASRKLYAQKLGFRMLLQLLKHVTEVNQIEELLSGEVVQSLRENLKKHNLNSSIAQSVGAGLADLVKRVQHHDFQMRVIRCLLTPLDHDILNNAMFTKIISDIRSQLKEIGIKMFGMELMKLILGGSVFGSGKTRKATAAVPESSSISAGEKTGSYIVQHWAASELSILLVLPSTQSDWQVEVLQFLFLHGFFVITRATPDIPFCDRETKSLPGPVKSICQANFFKSFQKVISFKSADRSNKVNYLEVIRQLFKFVQKLVMKSDVVRPLKELTKESTQSLKSIKKTLKKLHSEPSTIGLEINAAFEILLIYLGLQLFSNPKNSVDVLEDVTACYEKASKNETRKRDKEEPLWIEVITEVLISMMSQTSHLARVIASLTFSMLCPNMIRESLALILTVLRHDDEMEQDGPLVFEGGDEEMEEDEADVSKANYDLKMATEDRSKGSSESESSEDEMDDVEPEFRQTVKAALGTASADMDEEDLSDLSDSEMFKHDEALAAAFCGLNKKERMKEAKIKTEQVIAFKIRVLDLLENFVKSQPAAHLAVEIILPLVILMKSSLSDKNEADLGHKAARVLQHLYRQKLTYSEEVDRDMLLFLLEDLVKFSQQVLSTQVIQELSSSCLLVIKILTAERAQTEETPSKKRKRETHFERALELLKTALTSYFTRLSNPHERFFQNLLQKQSKLLWPLSDLLLEVITDQKIRVFGRIQACKFLKLLLNKETPSNIGAASWQKFSTRLTDSIFQVIGDTENIKLKFAVTLLSILDSYFNISKQLECMAVSTEVIAKIDKMRRHFSGSEKKLCRCILQKLQPVNK